MRSLGQSLWDRLRSNLKLKLLLLLVLPTVTTTAYLIVQRVILLPTWRLPVTWLDKVIPFDPVWVWAYLSLYLLMPIAPLLTRSREDLLRYTRGVLFYFAIGLICFALFPSPGPRPLPPHEAWLYNGLISIDRPYNSIPSLHATCAVFAVLYAGYASRETNRRRLRLALLGVAWLWVGLILYSTVATRQHFAVDLLPGIILGVVAFRWAIAKPRDT